VQLLRLVPAIAALVLLTAQAAFAEAPGRVRHSAAPGATGSEHATARGKGATPVRPVALPDDSPWALPPMLVLRARPLAGADEAWLRKRVLRSGRIALSPRARADVSAGRVDAGALALLLRKPKTGAPLLVFRARGLDVQAQETTLWMTRRTVRVLAGLPPRIAPARLLLEPSPGARGDTQGPPKPTAGQLRTLVNTYRAAGYRYGVDWKVLAAINVIETNLGSNQNVSSAGAVGWMQFMPATWRMYGTDANGDGVADPYNPEDAIFSAARYLQAAGAETDIRRALFAYNHANWYVNQVLRIAATIPDAPRS
jgi:Transglycosylase SLT domain